MLTMTTCWGPSRPRPILPSPLGACVERTYCLLYGVKTKKVNRREEGVLLGFFQQTRGPKFSPTEESNRESKTLGIFVCAGLLVKAGTAGTNTHITLQHSMGSNPTCRQVVPPFVPLPRRRPCTNKKSVPDDQYSHILGPKSRRE